MADVLQTSSYLEVALSSLHIHSCRCSLSTHLGLVTAHVTCRDRQPQTVTDPSPHPIWSPQHASSDAECQDWLVLGLRRGISNCLLVGSNKTFLFSSAPFVSTNPTPTFSLETSANALTRPFWLRSCVVSVLFSLIADRFLRELPIIYFLETSRAA